MALAGFGAALRRSRVREFLIFPSIIRFAISRPPCAATATWALRRSTCLLGNP